MSVRQAGSTRVGFPNAITEFSSELAPSKAVRITKMATDYGHDMLADFNMNLSIILYNVLVYVSNTLRNPMYVLRHG